VASGDMIIQPRGYTITPETALFHGITNEMAQRDGVPIEQCLDTIANLIERNNLCLVAHNVAFDRQVVLNELLLAGRPTQRWSTLPTYCTVLKGMEFAKIPNPNRYFGGYKYPTLDELYRHFIPVAPAGSGPRHRVKTDIEMLLACFLCMKAPV